MGCVLTAFTPDVWPPSNPSRRGKVATGSARGNLAFHRFRQALAQWAVFQRLSLRTFGRPQTLPGRVRLPLAAGFGTMGCFYRLSIRTFGRPQTLPGGVRLPLALLGASKLGFSPFPAGSGTMGCILTAFNPDVWPPSNPSRRGKVATGSARGLKTWLFTVSGRLWHNGLCFNACHSGRLAALKPSPAGYGCHWLQALAQWAVFYRLSIRTFGRPQTLPGGVRLPLALLGASKLGFSPFPAGSGTMGCVFNGFHSGRLAALKPFPAGYGCHWLC